MLNCLIPTLLSPGFMLGKIRKLERQVEPTFAVAAVDVIAAKRCFVFVLKRNDNGEYVCV